MDPLNITISSSNGDVIAYAYEDPFEIVCVPQLTSRLTHIIESVKVAADAHTELTDATTKTPIPPHTHRITPHHVVFEIFQELSETTDFVFDEPNSKTREELRNQISGEVLMTEEDFMTDGEYYTLLAEKTEEITRETENATERMVQRELEKKYSRHPRDYAEQQTRDRFTV